MRMLRSWGRLDAHVHLQDCPNSLEQKCMAFKWSSRCSNMLSELASAERVYAFRVVMHPDQTRVIGEEQQKPVQARKGSVHDNAPWYINRQTHFINSRKPSRRSQAGGGDR